jgi:murein DD-endopeptidase MepM/ murein hydrolase activator NlpD
VQRESALTVVRDRLARQQSELRRERIREGRARARVAHVRDVLSERLIALYKADEPDAVTVLLEANGFVDLLERAEFMNRIARSDGRLLQALRVARAEASAAARRMGDLTRRTRAVAALRARERDAVAGLRTRLLDTRSEYQVAAADRRRLLDATRSRRRDWERQVNALQHDSRIVAARLRASSAGPSNTAAGVGLVSPSSAGFIWPVNGPVTSPFGPRWGRLHAGLDIGASEGTPIRAAAGGTVVSAGPMGAYGLYTCLRHSASLATCYAHQSRIAVAAGSSVVQGQVIGAVGNTGRSFGAHLHFEVRVNGAPQNPFGYL